MVQPGSLKSSATGLTFLKRLLFAYVGFGVLLLAPAASAQSAGPSWDRGMPEKQMEMTPFAPYHIIGNIYYVGTRAVSNYLIVTPAGNILINSNFEGTLPLVEKNIEALGFKLADTKILLICHAHHDGAGAAAEIIRRTGAKLEVMEPDVSNVEAGGKTDWITAKMPEHWYPASKVDRVLHDGDRVQLGGTVLTAHFTPGHTPGDTTWTMTAKEGGKSYLVVVSGGIDVHDNYNLINDPLYPHMADDFRRSFRVFEALPADVFLGNRPEYYNMEEKYARMKPGAPNPFIDRAGFKAYTAQKELEFRKEMDKQMAAAKAAQ